MTHIFVIAGHGAGDPGASGNGYTEAERVRALAAKIKAYGGDAVTVGDTSRNWYADNGISTLSISKSWQIIELHMDSASASARGGHVIINSGFGPDKYDTALAAFISGILPGRAQTIVKRNDLANPKRAAAKGYPYRLLECGFISNTQDVKIFNEKMDEIAKGILNVFGIGTSGFTGMDVGTMFLSNIFLLIFALVACTPLGKTIRQILIRYGTRNPVSFMVFNITEMIVPPILLILSVLALIGNSYNPFLYFQF